MSMKGFVRSIGQISLQMQDKNKKGQDGTPVLF